MKFFILFIIFNLSSLTFVQAEGIAQTPEVLEAEKSIWKIKNNVKIGTGFFISPNLFVTNLHVIETLFNIEGNLDNIYLIQKGNPNVLNIKQVVAISDVHDLAIIETKETSQNYLNNKELTPNEKLLLIGYPKGIFKRLKITKRINFKNNSLLSFSVNHSNVGGASGSPILNDQGQVVGVLSIANEDNTSNINVLYVIKTNHLKKFIAGNTGLNCKGINFKNCLEKEIENLKILAEQGDAEAQYRLADRYLMGRGLPKNNTLAFDLFYKAAMQEHPAAQKNLAGLYIKGIGVTKNKEKGFYWYKIIAMQGDPLAQFVLGHIYLNGQGVPQNFEEASYWLQKSAEQNNKKAQDLIYALETIPSLKRFVRTVYNLKKLKNKNHRQMSINFQSIKAFK